MIIKICGISDQAALKTAVTSGADWVGLMFHPDSPRNVTIDNAVSLRQNAGNAKIVVVTVNASDIVLDTIMSNIQPDMFQLHGDETPLECQAIKDKYHRPVIKAFPVVDKQSLDLIELYAKHIDYALLDAPAAAHDASFGGGGQQFTWSDVKDWEPPVPWLLAGGLSPDTVCAGILATQPSGVDVSSGVERKEDGLKGQKDPALIKRFIKEVRSCPQ